MRKSMAYSLALLPLATFAMQACDGTKSGSEAKATTGAKQDSSGRVNMPVDTLIVRMTGALVMVPAGRGGMNVLLPKDRPGLRHVARFGFGIEENNPRRYPCVDDAVFTRPPISGEPPTKEGICYVNLVDWEVLDLGASGTPSPAVQRLPDGVLDVSLLSQGHKAPNPNPGARSTVHFATGEAGASAGDQCSLAEWTYKWTNAQGGQHTETRELINVLSWRILNPGSQFRLRSKRNSAVIHTVQLPVSEEGKIEMVLAHVPMKDLGHLPPGPEATLEQNPPQQANHIDLYYETLRRPGTGGKPGAAHRRIPQFSQSIRTKACPVAITTSVQRFMQPFSVATYACMVGKAGEG